MENRSHALIAGLFAVLLGLASVAALWWFGGKHEDTRDYLVVTTRSVTGLNPQGQVRFRGIRVGRVEGIELDPTDIRKTLIRIRIRSNIPVTTGTVARLGFQGVTGIAHVQLEDAAENAPALPASAGELPRLPMRESFVQEVADTGAETLRNVRDLVASLNQTLNAENRQSLVRTLANLEAVSGNAREASAQLRVLLSPENRALLQASLRRVEQATGQAAPLLTEVRGVVAKWQAVGEKLDVAMGEGGGAGIGNLAPRLNELAEELASTSRHLGRVLQVIE